MPHHGLDYFTSSPGVVDQKHCLVCGSACLVQRDVRGPTGFAMALAKRQSRYDAFACVHADQSWHRESTRLVLARNQTPSKSVAALVQADLDELLQKYL